MIPYQYTSPVILAALVGCCFFNLEELEHSKYGIEMSSVPVTTRPEAYDPHHLIMKSKYGQEYACMMPSQPKLDPELEAVLSGMKSRFNTPSDCVIRTKGYWTYRVCYGASVLQFHEAMPSKRRLVPKEFISIGVYERDLDWKEKLTKNDLFDYEQLPKAHKQWFEGGDICDETDQPRRAVVSYTCDPDAQHDFISVIQERQLCSYKIVVNTRKMCKHTFFMPGHASVRHKIRCSPIANKPITGLSAIKDKLKHSKEELPPSWVGNNPVTKADSLGDYISDISNARKQAPNRAIKQMFKKALSELQKDISSVKGGKVDAAKIQDLKEIDLDKLSQKDIDNIFKSSEVESTISKLAKATQRELEKLKTAASNGAPKIEVKVVYRDGEGNIKVSDADGDTPVLQDTILQLIDYNAEQRDEKKRQQTLINTYNFLEQPSQSDQPTDVSSEENEVPLNELPVGN